MSNQKKVVARWRAEPRRPGLAGVSQGIRGIELRAAGELIITVAAIRGTIRTQANNGWYWCGLGQNTSKSPCATMEEAKAQADAHYKSVMEDRKQAAKEEAEIVYNELVWKGKELASESFKESMKTVRSEAKIESKKRADGILNGDVAYKKESADE